MAVPYQKVTTDDQDLNRVQAEVAKSFQAVPDAVTDADGITTVNTVSGTSSFTVPESCKWLVCKTDGNALTVSLGSPRSKRTTVVVCAGVNKVTVQRQDGKTSVWGQSLTLEQNQSRLFVADGQDWV